MSKNYTINYETKVIEADISKLTTREKKEINNHLDLKFTLVPRVKVETKKSKEEEEAERIANPFSEINVQKYLEKNASQKQKEKYWEKYNEQAKDSKTKMPLYYKKDTPDGKHKAGEPRVKAHIATLGWFKKEFPNYEEEFKASLKK